MFAAIRNPAPSLGVPGWLRTLCARLDRSREPLRRAAAYGLVVNHLPSDMAIAASIADEYVAWVNQLTAHDLDSLESEILLEVRRMHRWLVRLARDGFPEGDLVAFGCAREMLESAACALRLRGRESSIKESLERLDLAASEAIFVHTESVRGSRRPLCMRREVPLLVQARERGVTCWWGMLAGEEAS